jgi:putative ABC transport system permease protein
LRIAAGLHGESVVALRSADSSARRAFLADVTGRMRQLPGVVSVATGSGVPPRMGMMMAKLVLEGEDPSEVPAAPPASAVWVSPEYFATLRMRFVEGRGFDETDVLDRPSPVVVNESFARARWSDPNVVGQRFKFENGETSYRVVGVAQDVAASGLGTSHERAQFYFTSRAFGFTGTALIVRTTGDPLTMVHQLKQQVWSLDPKLPVDDVAVVERMLSESIARERFGALLLSAFALLALVLAAIGVYGVIALAVSQRTREIGVRVALGAQRHDIAKMVVGYGMKTIAVGIVLGIAGSLVASRVLRNLLFEVQPTDPLTYGVVVFLLAAVGLTAAYLPSHRATAIDPLDALREE